MTTAILDTNVVVQSTISSRRSASAQVIDAYYAGRFQLVFSPATADELLAVMTVPQIRARHGWDDAEILRFITSLLAGADINLAAKVFRQRSRETRLTPSSWRWPKNRVAATS